MTSVMLPIITMVAGGLFAMMLGNEYSVARGAEIGLAIGCFLVAAIWAAFAILRRWAE